MPEESIRGCLHHPQSQLWRSVWGKPQRIWVSKGLIFLALFNIFFLRYLSQAEPQIT
jgi:hypothetical protein